MKPSYVKVKADMSLEEALLIMGDEEMVPVINEQDKTFAGMLLKSDLMNLYNKEVMKKAFQR